MNLTTLRIVRRKNQDAHMKFTHVQEVRKIRRQYYLLTGNKALKGCRVGSISEGMDAISVLSYKLPSTNKRLKKIYEERESSSLK